MAAYLLAGFDFARLGTHTLAFSDDGGAASFSLTTGTHALRDLSSVTGLGTYTSIAAKIAAEMNAASAGAGTYTATWSSTTYRFTIAYSAGNFSLTLSGSDAALRMGRLLGFSTNQSGAASYVSTRTPYYVLALAKAGPADYSRDFEVPGQVRRQVSGNGRAFSIGPRTFERRTKLALKFNTLSSTFADEATAAAPWTYEHLVTHARAHQPILLSYPAEDLVFKLVKPEFDEDARNPPWQDYHGLWHLGIEGQVLGRL